MSEPRPGVALPEGFHPVPYPAGADGVARTVGFEIEYGGVALVTAARIITNVFGGTIRSVSAFEVLVEDTPHGTFRVEVDAGILRDRSYLKILDELGIGPLTDRDTEHLDNLLMRISSTVVPFEIVTPPIALDDMAQVDTLRGLLHDAGAEGTGASWLNAFGLHINPQAPSMDAASILDHLRAFIVLYEWVCQQAPVDWSRRLGPHIEPFEASFSTHIMQSTYAPTLDELIVDYLGSNPTRNRALDLLPLLAHADAATVAATVANVSARPTYHYRLPNCRISDGGWRIAHAWNSWAWIERLAADSDLLQTACRDWLQAEGEPPAAQIDAWLATL